MNIKIHQPRAGYWIWVVSSIITLVLVTILLTSALVYYAMNAGAKLSRKQVTMVISIAQFPFLVKRVVLGLYSGSPLLLGKVSVEKPYWVRKFPAPEDKGYLLFSGVSQGKTASVVQLIRISDGQVMARWDPDWDAIYRKITDKKAIAKGNSDEGRAMHPVLLDTGDIIFNNDRSLVRINLCNSQPSWVIDEAFHHSNEMALDGVSIWTSAVSIGYFSDNSRLEEKLRDDSLARVSLDGKVLENHSFSKILIDNGFRALLLGSSGYHFNGDPIHINQISVASTDTKHWKRGDLLITARHMSTVFLYRPSTGKIIWHQQGPWMNQHSALFVDDNRISIFDNNVYSGFNSNQPFVKPEETNRVWIYDFTTQQVTQPYAKLLREARPVTISEGRAQVLSDGGLFIEESNFGRHLRFTKDKLLWSRINDYDNNYVGLLSWSRYITAKEVEKPLAAIASHQCGTK